MQGPEFDLGNPHLSIEQRTLAESEARIQAQAQRDAAFHREINRRKVVSLEPKTQNRVQSAHAYSDRVKKNNAAALRTAAGVAVGAAALAWTLSKSRSGEKPASNLHQGRPPNKFVRWSIIYIAIAFTACVVLNLIGFRGWAVVLIGGVIGALITRLLYRRNKRALTMPSA